MARGVKRLTLDEQLAKVTGEIEKVESSLNELKATKEELEKQIKLNRLEELDTLISSKGLSYDDLKVLLDKE